MGNVDPRLMNPWLINRGRPLFVVGFRPLLEGTPSKLLGLVYSSGTNMNDPFSDKGTIFLSVVYLFGLI